MYQLYGCKQGLKLTFPKHQMLQIFIYQVYKIAAIYGCPSQFYALLAGVIKNLELWMCVCGGGNVFSLTL